MIKLKSLKKLYFDREQIFCDVLLIQLAAKVFSLIKNLKSFKSFSTKYLLLQAARKQLPDFDELVSSSFLAHKLTKLNSFITKMSFIK